MVEQECAYVRQAEDEAMLHGMERTIKSEKLSF